MDRFRIANLTSRDQLVSTLPSSREGKKESQKKLKSSRSSSEFKSHSSEEKLRETTGVPMKSLLAQEMSKQKESKRRSPSIIARLMGLDVLPPQRESHKPEENQQVRREGFEKAFGDQKTLRRMWKGEQKFKDVFEVLDAKKVESSRNLYQERVNANLTQAEMAFIRQKFMEAKRLSTDEKLRHSKEFNDALEALDSNKDLLLKFLQHPDSLFTKHLHDLQSIPPKPLCGQAKSPNNQRNTNSLKTQKVDRELLRKSQRQPHQHGSGVSSCSSHSRHVSYDSLDLGKMELEKRSGLQPTKIVVLKPNLGETRYSGRNLSSPSSSSDEFRADRRLPCTSNQELEVWGRQKSNEDISFSRHKSRDSGEISKIMSRQRKTSIHNGSSTMSFEASGFRGYAGDESSSGSSDSASESELVPVTSRTRTFFNRKNSHRPLASKSTSSVSREAKRRLSERWKLTHRYEQEIEISRSGTLAEMLANSDREARPASFNGLSFEEGISKRFENNSRWSELPEPVGISSRDGWKGSSSRNISKSRTIMNQESTGGYTIVLPKALVNREFVKGNSSRQGESFLSSKSRPGSNKSHSSYCSSPEVNIHQCLSKVQHYMNDEVRKETLAAFNACSSFSVDVNSDTEDGSASDDIKTTVSSEPPDLSTVTSLTDPDILRRPTEEVNHTSAPGPQSRENSKEGDQPSPVSVLETSFSDDFSSSSECFGSVNADLQGLRKQLQLLKLESSTYNEGAMLVSSDEDSDQENASTLTDDTMLTQELREDWKALYLVDVLTSSRFSDSDHNIMDPWHSSQSPVEPSLFEDLEKKYSNQKPSTRLERRFLFDQISDELSKIFKQFSNPNPWVKPTRISPRWDLNKIEETLRNLVTRKEEKPSKDVEYLQWLSLEDEIEFIGRDIEEMLTDELISELVLDSMI